MRPFRFSSIVLSPVASLVLAAILVISTSGCATVKERFRNRPVTRIAIQSFDVRGHGQSADDMYRGVTRTLIDRGYDIKGSDQDAGFITTEYQKYASFGTSPPFDYFLQIRTVIRENSDGSLSIQLRPTVKQQNRLNAAAFTEEELEYFTGPSEDVALVGGMNDGWMDRGLVAFMNIVSDIGDLMGVSMEDVRRDVTETPYVITWRGDLVAVNPQ